MSLITPNRHIMGSTRSSLHSIMANSGFGAMTIFRKDGAVIEVPANQIAKNSGRVKTAVRKDMDELTREKIESLEKRGVKLYVGKVDM